MSSHNFITYFLIHQNQSWHAQNGTFDSNVFFLFLFQLPEEVSNHQIAFQLKLSFVSHNINNCVCVSVCVPFSSTQEKDKCIWRKTSSDTIVLLHAQRPSSTCGRCPPTFASRRENISLCPPPLSPIRMETSMCGCFQRNRLTSSMPLPQTSANFGMKLMTRLSNGLVMWFRVAFREIDDPVDCHVAQVKSHSGLRKHTS